MTTTNLSLQAHIRYAETTVTHLMWVGRWIEVTRGHDVELGPTWTFKNGRDAADWLLRDDAA